MMWCTLLGIILLSHICVYTNMHTLLCQDAKFYPQLHRFWITQYSISFSSHAVWPFRILTHLLYSHLFWPQTDAATGQMSQHVHLITLFNAEGRVDKWNCCLTVHGYWILSSKNILIKLVLTIHTRSHLNIDHWPCRVWAPKFISNLACSIRLHNYTISSGCRKS